MAQAQLKNFQAADRKRNIKAFGLMPIGLDLAWIANNAQQEPEQTYTVVPSPTPTFEVTDGTVQTITLTGDILSSSITYLGSPTAAPDGQPLTLRIAQDSTGGHLFALPPNVASEPGYQVNMEPDYCTVIQLMWSFDTQKWEPIATPVTFPLAI